MCEMRLDAASTAAGDAVMSVMSVMMMVMMVMIQMRRLDAAAAIGSLLVLEFLDATVVTLELVSKKGVFFSGTLLVVLEASDAVQSVQIDPTAPRHADAVHDQVRLQVNLETKQSLDEIGHFLL